MVNNRYGRGFIHFVKNPRISCFGANDANRAGKTADDDQVPELEVNVNQFAWHEKASGNRFPFWRNFT